MTINPNINKNKPLTKIIHPERVARPQHPSIDSETRDRMKEKLLDPADTTPISQKQFALMFGDTFIQATGLEGGNSMDSAAYYQKEVEKWSGNAPFSPEITQACSTKLQDSLQIYIDAEGLIRFKDHNRLSALVNEQLKASNSVTIPANIRGKPGLPGHTFSVVIERTPDGKLIFYFMNKGEGSELHPEVKTSGIGKSYVSYRSPSFVLKDSVSFEAGNEHGLKFLDQLIKFYHLQPKSDDLYNISSQDLYQHLQVFSDQEASKALWKSDQRALALTEDLGVTSQRSGICPEAAIRLLMRNTLVQLNEKPAAIKKTLFFYKLRGLRNGLLTLPLTDTTEGKVNLGLLKNAAKGFAVETDKLIQAGSLKHEEATAALILVEEVLRKVKEMHELHRKKIEFPLLDSLEHSLESAHMGITEKPPEIQPPKQSQNPSFTNIHEKERKELAEAIEKPEKILTFLNNLANASYLLPTTSRDFVRELLFHLPVPQSGEDLFWNQIGPKDAIEMISKLTRAMNAVLEIKGPSHYTENRLMLFQCAAISHKLLSLNPRFGETLAHYAIPFNRSRRPEHFFYPDATLSQMEANLMHYFDETLKPKALPLKTKTMDSPVNLEPLIKAIAQGEPIEPEWGGHLSFYFDLMKALKIQTTNVPQTIFEMIQGYLPNNSNVNAEIQAISQMSSYFCTAQEFEGFQKAPTHLVAWYGQINNFRTNPIYETLAIDKNTLLTLPSMPEQASTWKGNELPANLRDISALQHTKNAAHADALEQLLRVRGSLHFSIPLMIRWCRQYPLELENEPVQNHLITSILLPNVIENASKNAPEQIAELRSWIDQSIKSSLGEGQKHELALFWLKTSCLVEARLKKENDIHSTERLQAIPEEIHAILKRVEDNPPTALKAAYQLLLTLSLQIPLSPDQCQLFIHTQIEIAFLTRKANYTPPLFIQQAIQRASFLMTPELLQQMKTADLSDLASRLFLSDEAVIVRRYPEMAIGDYTIDLSKGLIKKGDRAPESFWISSQIYVPSSVRAFLSNWFGNTVYGYCSSYFMEADNGAFRAYEDDRKTKSWQIDVKIRIGGKEELYRRLPPERAISGLPESLQKCERLVSHSNPSQIVLLDDLYRPAYLIHLNNPPSTQIERLNEATPKGEFLFPIQDSPLEGFLSKLVSPDRIRIFCTETEGHLIATHIELANLSVEPETQNGQIRFKLKDIPNFYLSEEQSEDPLMIGRSLYIEDASGKERRMILLPQHFEDQRESLGEQFAKALEQDLKEKRHNLSTQIPFIYSIHPQTGSPKGESIAANLYLTGLYMSQGRCLEAFDLLSSIQFHQAPTDTELYLFKQIIKFPQMNPEACALKLHTLIVLKSTDRILTKRGKQGVNRTTELLDELSNIRVAEKNGQFYLSTTGDQGIQRIPDLLRLSNTDLKELSVYLPSNRGFNPFALITKLKTSFDSSFYKSRIFQVNNLGYKELKECWELIQKEGESIDQSLKILALQLSSIKFSEQWGTIFLLYQLTKNQTLKGEVDLCLISEESLSVSRTNLEYIIERLQNRLIETFSSSESKTLNPAKAVETESFSAVLKDKTPLQLYLVNQPTPVVMTRSTTPPVIDENTPKTSKTAQISENLKTAHEVNQKGSFTIYQPLTGNIPEASTELLQLLVKEKGDLQLRAESTLSRLISLANYPNNKELASLPPEKRAEILRYRVKHSHHLPLSLSNTLVQALKSNNRSVIAAKNPFLSSSQLEELMSITKSYVKMMVHLRRLDSASELLEKSSTSNYSKAIRILNQDSMDNLSVSEREEFRAGAAFDPDQRSLTASLSNLGVKYDLIYCDQERDKLFQHMDQILTRATLPHQGNLHQVIDDSPFNLVKNIPSNQFKEIEGILNLASLGKGASSEEWAKAFLTRAQNEGLDKRAALFFSTDPYGKSILLIKWAGDLESNQVVSLEDLPQFLKTNNLKPDQLYKIYDEENATQVFLPISTSARMILTVNDQSGFTSTLQAIMRMESFIDEPLDPAQSQRLLWMGHTEQTQDLKDFFIDALERDVVSDQSELFKHAVRNIEGHINKICNETGKPYLSLPDFNEWIEKRRSEGTAIEQTRDLLLSYAQYKLGSLGFQISIFQSELLDVCMDVPYTSLRNIENEISRIERITPELSLDQIPKIEPQEDQEEVSSNADLSVELQPLYISPSKGQTETLLQPRIIPSAEAFSLNIASYTPINPLAGTLAGDLQKAHEMNLKERFPSHKPLSRDVQKTASKVRKLAKNERIRLQDEATITLQTLEKLANYPDDKDFALLPHDKKAEVLQYRVKQGGGQIQPLTLRNPLLNALLMRSPESIFAKNPFLSASQLAEIERLTIHYLDTMNAVSRIESAEDLFKNVQNNPSGEAQFSKAVEILNHERTFDPYAFPELALYEYATGFQLRTSQVEILQWIFTHMNETHAQEKIAQLAFEFQAGGGKTKVISTILAAKVIAQGKIPIFFSLPHLYDVTREDFQGALIDIFQLKLQIVEFSLKDTIEERNIRQVVQTFNEALKNKQALFMTPESWHVLHLTKLQACKNSQTNLIKACDELFDLMKEHGFGLIDEAHLNADALQQTNRASGLPLHIPINERKIFSTMAKFLMEDPLLVKLVKLAENNQTTMLDEDLIQVKKRLTRLFMDYLSAEIPPHEREGIQAYWLNQDAPRTEWLQSLKDKREVNENVHELMLSKRIDLIRGLIHTVLPFALTQSKGLDYLPSEQPSVDLWIPAKQGIGSDALFQNPDVAALLTCFGTMQSGLTFDQLKNSLSDFLQIFERELKQENSAQSKIAIKWDQMQKNSKVPRELCFTLHQYNQWSPAERIQLIQKIHPYIHKNLELIELYLNQSVLPQILIYPSKEQSTASQLVKAFSSSILFSATLGTHEKYTLQTDPQRLHRRDLQFMDQVITRACLPHQGDIHWIPDGAANHIIKAIGAKEFRECEGIINVASFSEEASNEDWADAFLSRAKLENLDKKAAIFFRESDKGEKKLWLKIKGEPDQMIPVSGSNINAVLKAHSLTVDQTYKIFGPSETTGTDLPISPNGRMIFTVGDNVNLSLAVQSIMRMRGFLNDPIDPQSSQKLLWVSTPEFQEKVREVIPQGPIGPQAFFVWSLEKEASIDQSTILQQATQEIDAIILEEAEQKRRSSNQLKHKAYSQSLGRDPSSLYGGENQEIDTEIWLQSYVEMKATEAELIAPNRITGIIEVSLSPPRQERLNQVIERTSKIVPKTKTRGNSALNGRMEQKTDERAAQQVRQEQRTQQKENTVRTTLRGDVPEQSYHDRSLFKGPLKTTFQDHLFLPKKELPSFFSEDLCFFHNAVCVDQYEPNPSLIKEVDFLLVEEIDGIKTAFALSSYDAEEFLKQLSQPPYEGSTPKKLCLFTASGDIAKIGAGEAGYSAQEMAQFQKSSWMQEKIHEIGLWNGKIVDIRWMETQLDPKAPLRREQTLDAWSFISNRHANQAHLQRTLMNELISGPTPQIETIMAGDVEGAKEYPFAFNRQSVWK